MAPEGVSTEEVKKKSNVDWQKSNVTWEQMQEQIERQKKTTAEILGIPPERVIAVSAQKGLVAKVTEDDELLEKSCLPVLEDALGRGMMGKRQKILADAMVSFACSNAARPAHPAESTTCFSVPAN